MDIDKLLKFLKREVGCEFQACDSSNIMGYGYKESDKQLWVIFKNQSIYCYTDISKDLFMELSQAESKGKWVNTNLVKPKLPCKRYGIS